MKMALGDRVGRPLIASLKLDRIMTTQANCFDSAREFLKISGINQSESVSRAANASMFAKDIQHGFLTFRKERAEDCWTSCLRR